MQQEKSSRQKRRNLGLKDYQSAEDDPRPIVDTKLEWEADRSGVIHLRKYRSETEMLPGYGITDFGVSAYETKKTFTASRLLLAAGIATSGFLAWKFKDKIPSQLKSMAEYAKEEVPSRWRFLSDLALIVREAYRA